MVRRQWEWPETVPIRWERNNREILVSTIPLGFYRVLQSFDGALGSGPSTKTHRKHMLKMGLQKLAYTVGEVEKTVEQTRRI